MNADVLATVLTGVGVLVGVWRIVTVQVDSVRHDLTAQIAAADNKLSAAIRDVNTRIDNILLADRKPNP